MSFERRKIRTGRVVSDKMDKTAVVVVEWRRRHPLYGKAMRRITKFNVHDETNESIVGDVVEIVESRPLSKSKRWRLKKIISRVDIAEVQFEDIIVDPSVVPSRVRRRLEEATPVAEVSVEAEDVEDKPKPQPSKSTKDKVEKDEA